MGAGAFIMSEMTGIPYLEIIKVAAVPGILYFLLVGVMVYFESRKLGLKGFAKEDLPALARCLAAWLVSTPADRDFDRCHDRRLLASDRGALRILLNNLVSWIRPDTRMGPEQIWQALVNAGKNCVFVAALTGCVGVLIGVLSLTGIIIRFPYMLIELAGQKCSHHHRPHRDRHLCAGFASADHRDLFGRCGGRRACTSEARCADVVGPIC